MAKFLRFDKRAYSPSTGLLPLRRGDDWALSGQIVERFAGYEAPLDCSNVDSATGYFPASESCTGGTFAKAVTFLDKTCGMVQLPVTSDETPQIQANDDGIGIYLVLQRGATFETVEQIDRSLEIKDRGDLEG